MRRDIIEPPRFLSLEAAEAIAVTAPDGAQLPLYSLAGPVDAPSVLVAHANGFAAGSYAPWLRMLAATMRVFAYDARGHGGASWPAGPLDAVFHVDRFADELAAVAATVASRLDGAPLFFVGHSLGAATLLRLATRAVRPLFARALLFEPPVFPSAGAAHHAEAAAKQLPLIERSAQRRAHWKSPDALYRLLKTRGMFQRFRSDMLAAHCRATLRPLPGGGYTLACPPDVESSIFRSHRMADTWGRLPAVRERIHLVSSDTSTPERSWVSAVLPEMAARIPGATLDTLPGTGHMLIFEAPDVCRDLVLARFRGL
ncbi:MAG TPA: alpha/beta hydrolase [Stellaceae bacterium]|nr:alpha/beta hydrolase [Stellaceae bacterium]